MISKFQIEKCEKQSWFKVHIDRTVDRGHLFILQKEKERKKMDKKVQ